MNIISVIGLMGAGKGTFAHYVSKKYGYFKITYGDIIRDLARQRGLELTRENLQAVRRETLKKYGPEYVGKLVAEKIRNHKKAVIDGVRLIEDINPIIKEYGKPVVVLIETKPEIRFERMRKRNRPGDPKTLEEFKDQEEKEKKLFDFDRVFALADYKIKNNGTLEEFYRKIDDFMKKSGLD